MQLNPAVSGLSSPRCAVLCVVILTKCIHPMVTGMHCDVYLLRCITWHYGQDRATPSLDFPNERQDSPACPVGCRSRHTQGGCILYRHFTRKIVRSLWRRLLLLVSCRHPGSTHSSNTARAHCSIAEGRTWSEALSFCFVWHLEIPWVCFSSSQVREGLQRDQTCLL